MWVGATVLQNPSQSPTCEEVYFWEAAFIPFLSVSISKKKGGGVHHAAAVGLLANALVTQLTFSLLP
jgi:hypothetical protein